MKVYLGSDHGGFHLKEAVKAFLLEKHYDVVDCGAYTYDKNDDYPDFVSKAADGVAQDPDVDRGIVFGGSGEAEMMVANKYKGVRCALFYTLALPVQAVDVNGRMSTDPFEIIRLTREHNNANMLSLGGRFLQESDVLQAVELWLNTPFSGDVRHVRRIAKMKQIEEK